MARAGQDRARAARAPGRSHGCRRARSAGPGRAPASRPARGRAGRSPRSRIRNRSAGAGKVADEARERQLVDPDQSRAGKPARRCRPGAAEIAAAAVNSAAARPVLVIILHRLRCASTQPTTSASAQTISGGGRSRGDRPGGGGWAAPRPAGVQLFALRGAEGDDAQHVLKNLRNGQTRFVSLLQPGD